MTRVLNVSPKGQMSSLNSTTTTRNQPFNPPTTSNTFKMAPRKREQTPSTSTPVVTSTPQSSRPTSSSKNNSSSAQQIVDGIWKNYVNKTPQRVKLLDAFMAFLAVVGALQFVYCVIVGNFVSYSLYCIELEEHHYIREGRWEEDNRMIKERTKPTNSENTSLINCITALQRLPRRLQLHSRSIRPHSFPPHADEPRKPRRIQEYIRRTVSLPSLTWHILSTFLKDTSRII
jgi:hypothetical protein